MIRFLLIFFGFLISSPVFAFFNAEFNAELVKPQAYIPPSSVPTPSPQPSSPPIPPRSKPVMQAAPMKINDYPFDTRARYRAGFVGTRASLNLGTRTVAVPVALRVAGGAAGFAVSAFNPWVAGAQLALLAVPFIIDWFSANPDSGLSVDENRKIVKIQGASAPVVPGFPGLDVGDIDIERTKILQGISIAEALQSGVGVVSNTHYCSGISKNFFRLTVGSSAGSWCGYGATSVINARTCKQSGGYFQGNSQDWILCPSPAVVTRKPGQVLATLEDFSKMVQVPIDPQAMAELDIPIMVEDLPIINPAPWPDVAVKVGETNPAIQLQPQPIRYPNGTPVLIPGTNPPLYTQPWYEVNGSPTPDNPWRVVIVHVTTTTNDPKPLSDPIPSVPPPSVPTDCDKFINALGCMPVDILESEQISKVEKSITLQAGPSFSAGASCPPDLSINFQGHTFSIPAMTTACNWISFARPVVLLLAALTAVAIVRPGGGPKNAKAPV